MSGAPVASVALWMPWFIKDHRADASTLTHTEHSVRCFLVMLLWERDGSIPDDDRWIAKQVRLTVPQWKAMRTSLTHDCVIAAGTISHPKLQAEITKAKVNVEQKRKAGIASAEARKNQRLFNGCSTAVQPRAGSGVGVGPLPRDELTGGSPFSVVEGGK